jgi:zinc transport system permease protein
MVIALLTIPAAIARMFSRSLHGMMARAVLLSAVFSMCGLWFSVLLDIASGATIILVAGFSFLLAHAWRLVTTFLRAQQ